MTGTYILIGIGLFVYLICFCLAAMLIYLIIIRIIDRVCDTVLRLHEKKTKTDEYVLEKEDEERR